MGFYQTLTQKIRKHRIDRTIKRTRQLLTMAEYEKARVLIRDVRNFCYGHGADRYRFDEVRTLHKECECSVVDWAIAQAEALMEKGKYEAARNVLEKYAWDPWYREEEVDALVDRCERAMAGQPQETPAPTPEPKPTAPDPQPAAPSSRADALREHFAREKEEFDRCRADAHLGDTDAQYRLGEMYYLGRGTDENISEALDWLRKAGDQGHAEAQHLLGVIYRKGHKVPRDEEESLRWHRLAAAQGHSGSRQAVEFLERRKQEAVDSEAHVKPDASAPKPKVEPKPAPAPKPAAKSAEELHDEAWACEQQDPARALRLYEQAAGMGYILSQYNCGMLYFEGVGCTRDYEKALDWFKEAATQGDADAQYMCARTIHEIKKTYIGVGTMEAWDTMKVCTDAILFWEKKAASQGHAEAQVALGKLYFGENDYETARYWLEKAVSQGNDDAKFWLEHLN